MEVEIGSQIEIESSHLMMPSAENMSDGKARQLASILMNMSDGYVRVDSNHIVVEINPAAVQILGFSMADEVIHRSLFDFVDSEGEANEYRDAVENNRVVHNHVARGRKKNGTDYWVSVRGIPISDETGKVVGREVFMRDITEQRAIMEDRAELLKKLEESMYGARPSDGLLPICAGCKDIRTEKDEWIPVEQYVAEKFSVHFTHGVCPDCMKRDFPDGWEKLYGGKQ